MIINTQIFLSKSGRVSQIPADINRNRSAMVSATSSHGLASVVGEHFEVCQYMLLYLLTHYAE